MKKLLLILLAAASVAACDDRDTAGKLYPPVFGEATFSSVAPTAGEEVVVRARVSCRSGLDRIALRYVCLLNGGVSGAVAGERLFTGSAPVTCDYEARIPGQQAGTRVQFVLVARSASGVERSSAAMGYIIAGGESPGPDPGPEYATRPEFGPVTFSPTAPADREIVTVRVPVTCKYGLNRIYIFYYLDGDEEGTIVGDRLFTGEAPTSYEYEAKIPG